MEEDKIVANPLAIFLWVIILLIPIGFIIWGIVADIMPLWITFVIVEVILIIIAIVVTIIGVRSNVRID